VHGVFQNRIESLASEAAVEGEKLIVQIGRILKENKRTVPAKGKQTIVEFHPSRSRRSTHLLCRLDSTGQRKIAMQFRIIRPYRSAVQTLNVIPFVDILFQLIIFLR